MSDKSSPDTEPVKSFKRSGEDRRQNNGSAFLKQFYMGRRHGERRDDVAAPSYYVDLHEPWLLVVVVLVLILCIMDSFNTMTLLDHGGEELNPFMKSLLETNVWLFFFVKYIITALGLIVLVMHKHFSLLRLIRAKYLLIACLVGYIALIAYEIYLLKVVVPQ